LAAAGRPEPEVLQGDWSARSGYELGQLLARRREVTAIFSANDSQAMGVMRALAESGRSIPGDVSVVGIDDVPEAEFQMVPLTTLRNDPELIADQVLTHLVDLIEGRDPDPPAVEISSELVVRASSGPPPRREPTSPASSPPPHFTVERRKE
jgi:DNA-binding LacI/PurR family transcriptional regulator